MTKMPQSTKILLSIKNGKFRKKIALCLRTWRKTQSIKETSKITGINRNTIKSCLACSRFYLKSDYCSKNNNRKILCENNKVQDAINIKNSAYRKNIATYLRIWRKTKSSQKVAKIFGVSPRIAYYFLEQSMAYKKRYAYRKNFSKSDLRYINKWAKKIKSIRLLGGKCETCRSTNIFSLDFHHKNKNTKIDRISNVLHKKWKDIKPEVLKCKLLCRNCHRELHNNNPRNKMAKKKLLEIINSTKCSKCGYNKNLSALEFHHVSKNKEINLFTKCRCGNNPKRQNKKLLKELNKCIVLCTNCHNEIHNNKDRFEKLKQKINARIITLND